MGRSRWNLTQGGLGIMRKSLVCLIMVLCLVVSSTAACFAELTGDFSPSFAADSSATSGVDIVVVLDMSGSMAELTPGKEDGNDRNGYRLDATAMLTGMLDMDGSRIGIVPFGGIIQNVKELTLPENRNDLIKYIYSLPRDGYGTNYGAALMRALYMLEAREDKTNSPMIVLMTDGKNSISHASGKVNISPSYRWDPETQQVKDEGTQAFDTALANKVTEEAADCAAALGIPIYTVSLTYSADDLNGTISLRELSRRTGVPNEGVLQARTKEDAKDIPRYFAEILAEKIGSSVKQEAKPIPVQGEEGKYSVNIPVLNASIREINIFLPVKTNKNPRVPKSKDDLSGILKDTIKVLNADGNIMASSDGVNIWANDDGSFAMIKIREPQAATTGKMWSLQFESVDQPDNVNFNFLYNYSIKLKAEVQNSGDLYKSDTLPLSAYFTDLVGGEEVRSEDPALYKNHDNDPAFKDYDWATIRAQWQLFTADGENAITAEPAAMTESEEQLAFVADIDLASLVPNLKAGNYLLKIRAEGAGLKRLIELPITLKNHAPEGQNYDAGIITVNRSEEAPHEGATAGVSWTVAGTSKDLELTADQIITDADSTDAEILKRSFRLEPDGDQQAATMELKSDGTIHVTTQADGQGGVQSGNVSYRLSYNDGDTNGQGSVLISLGIVSDDGALKEKYEPAVGISGSIADGSQDGDYQFKKNTSVDLTLKLNGKGGSGSADSETMEKLYHHLAITDQNGDAIDVSEPELTAEGWHWKVETTGNRAATWTAAFNLGTFEILPVTLVIPNQEGPKAHTPEQFTVNCSGEKVPGFLQTLIGKNTPEDDPGRIVRMADLFSDKDNDQLTFGQPQFNTQTGGTTDPEAMKAVGQPADTTEPAFYQISVNGKPTSLFKISYTYEMRLTAEDGDGETATYLRTITVVDLYNKMLTWIVSILIAIIILVILILIIHQIRKPRFPKLNLTIREEPSLYETSSEPLSPVKTPTNANAIGIDSDMATKHGLSLELLQNIIIKPIRSTLAIGVICKKEIGGQEVTLDDVRLKTKKLYTWRIGQELGIRSDHGEGMVVVKLEDRMDNGEDDSMEDFGGSDDWTDAGEETGGGKTVRKRSRKVQRTQKPAEEQRDAASGDDFDF